jgi:hypothetical protein
VNANQISGPYANPFPPIHEPPTKLEKAVYETMAQPKKEPPFVQDAINAVSAAEELLAQTKTRLAAARELAKYPLDILVSVFQGTKLPTGGSPAETAKQLAPKPKKKAPWGSKSRKAAAPKGKKKPSHAWVMAKGQGEEPDLKTNTGKILAFLREEGSGKGKALAQKYYGRNFNPATFGNFRKYLTALRVAGYLAHDPENHIWKAVK